MSQDDPQQPDRTGQPRISRDTLLLLGALAFLILAVALTFLFTPNQTADTLPTETPLAGVVGTSPPGGYPVGTATVGVEVTQPAGGEIPSAYPVPSEQGGSSFGATATALALLTPGLPGEPGGEFDTPTVEGGFDEPTVEGEPGDDDPYPAPEGSPPAQPTFNPTVSLPTSPPAQQPTFAQQQPTFAPPPTSAPPAQQPPSPTPEPPSPTIDPNATPEPTAEPTVEEPGEPVIPLPPLPAFPTLPPAPPPVDVLRGNVRWAAGQSPIILRRDVQIAPGAELIIEPGVEVRLDPGVSIYVDGGRVLALGLPDQRVRFVGNTGARWSGIYGLPDSFIALENTDIRGGGVGGTVMAIDRGELVMRSSKVNDNGGAILLTDTKLEMRDSEIAGNDMPYGAALDASYARGNFVVMRSNRIGGNILSTGAPMVRIASQSSVDTLNLEISGNLFRGGEPNLQLTTNGPLAGSVDCNAMVGEGLGFGLRTQTVQVGPNGTYTMNLRVTSNFIDEHVPPIVPVYLKYGLGRGAASEIMVDMRNNWWGEASGPYEPDENPEGRGDSVGENIDFVPWLTSPPACAPSR